MALQDNYMTLLFMLVQGCCSSQ